MRCCFPWEVNDIGIWEDIKGGFDFSYLLDILLGVIPSLLCITLHELSHGLAAYKDMEIDVEHFLKIKERLNKILAENTGKTPEQVKADSERDRWLTAEEAQAYGLIDKVIWTSWPTMRPRGRSAARCG